jgi:integrase
MNKPHKMDKGAGETTSPPGESAPCPESRPLRGDDAGTGGETAPRPSTARPISSIIDAHREELVRLRRAPNTISEYNNYGYKSLMKIGKTTDALTGENLLRFKETLLAAGRSVEHVNRHFAKMKAILKWASELTVNLVEKNPLDRLGRIPVAPDPDRAPKRTFTLDEARLLLHAADGTDLWLMLLIYLSTGMRKQEILRRVGGDWDGETKWLTVRIGPGNKTRREFNIPIGNVAAKRLDALNVASAEPLFPGKRGGFYDPRVAYGVLAGVCKKAGVPRGGFHAMRRCMASILAKRTDCGTASLVLGHSDGERTLAKARYIQSFADDARDAVQSMETLLLEG